MKSVAAVAAIIVLLLTGLFIGPFTATATAAPESAVDGRGPLRLDLSDMTPRLVTADGPDSLTVHGTLTNSGSVPIDDLVVRVQRSGALETEGELRDALDGNSGADAVTPKFLPLADELAPGASVPVRLVVPLRGDRTLGLALVSPGVYEILVNINGTPRDGQEARLVAIRLLLPVLSLPPDPAIPASKPVPPTDGPAVPFSMLFPITDVPRLLPGLPNETLLRDDTLAASFAPDGRLGGLVAALGELAPAGSRARSSTCLAIDPDLVQTATLMKDGYQVLGPDGAPVPGTGSAVAGQWLDKLAAVARSGCVVALPYADADLVAMTRAGLGDTAAAAIRDGRQVLTDLLKTSVLPSVTWPAGGFADEATLATLAGGGASTVVLSADGVEQGRNRQTSGIVPVAGAPAAGRLTAVLSDPLLTLAAEGPDPAVPVRKPAPGAAVMPTTVTGTVGPLSTQDAIGAITYRTADGPSPDGPLVLAPPHRWTADGTGARALLAAVGKLLDTGKLIPRPLEEAIAQGPPATAAARPLKYPNSAGGKEIPAAAVATIRTTAEDITDLRSAVVEPSPLGAPPDNMFVPLSRGVVRPASAALRGDPDAARSAADAAAARIRDLRNMVRVLEPPSSYSLGTSDAPLPLTVVNGLPVPVKVSIELQSTAGLRIAPVPPLEIPPQGRRQISASAQVTRSGQFTVDATVMSPDGRYLGTSSRLLVRSTAYGTITVWLTASAGGLLVLLVGRRVIRRIRKEPGRHSGTTTRTDPPLPTSPAAADPPEHQPSSPQPAGHPPVSSPRGGPPGSIPLPSHPLPSHPLPSHPSPSHPLPTRTGPGGHHASSSGAAGHPSGPRTDNPRTDHLSRRTGDPFPVIPGPQRGPTDGRTPRRIPPQNIGAQNGAQNGPQNIGRHPAYEDLAPTDRFPATQQDRRADRSRPDGGHPDPDSRAPDNRAQVNGAQDSRDPSHPHRSHQEPPHPDPRAAPRP